MPLDYPVASIDLAALKHNLARVRYYAPNSRVMSVIKANAYGHGMVAVARALADSDAFCVARLSEAVTLRQAGMSQDIVVLEGANTSRDVTIAAKLDLSLVINSIYQIELVCHTQLNPKLRHCWLMVETGMNRLGIALPQVDTAMQRLQASDNIQQPIGLMSHFANADFVGDSRNQKQLSLLQQLAQQHQTEMSIANSAAILSIPDSYGDWVRPGIMLYGASPFSDRSVDEFDLKPVMTLTTKIIDIKTITANEQVGYGGTWVAPCETSIAIIDMGYGDGYPRRLSNVAQVIIKQQRANVIGRVSMDMLAIDITGLDNISIADEVIIWGQDAISVDTIAAQIDTIPYELLTHINERVSRYYHG